MAARVATVLLRQTQSGAAQVLWAVAVAVVLLVTPQTSMRLAAPLYGAVAAVVRAQKMALRAPALAEPLSLAALVVLGRLMTQPLQAVRSLAVAVVVRKIVLALNNQAQAATAKPALHAGSRWLTPRLPISPH
jgi:hypothetical protein